MLATAPTIDLQGESTSPGRLARQLWEARELFLILSRKEFHVRYRRASFGILWALALPLLQAAVLALVFSKVAHIRAAPHYAVFVLAGMAPWSYFSMTISAGSTAVVDSTDLSSKVYFPRAVLPLAQLAANLYGYLVTVAIVLLLCPLFHVGLGPAALLLLPASILLLALTAGFCLTASALHVYFRDVRYIVSAALMVWFYVTPVVYPAGDASGKLRLLLELNPMTGILDLFRTATVGGVGPMAVPVLISLAWTLGLLTTATLLHCRYQRVFADLL
jgi:lipopolysaccharide transport system permease protein